MRNRILGACAALACQAVAAQTLHFVTQAFPPYTYANAQGQPAGPMVDVLKAACKQLGWQCPIEVLPWRRALNMAQRGEVEGIFTVLDSPERRQYFHITPAVVDGRYAFFAKSGNPLQYGSDRTVLEGHVIGAYGPSATALTLEQLVDGLSRVRTEIEPDNRTVLRKLAAGRYGEDGLVLANEAVAQHLIREEKLPGLIAVGGVKSFGYAFGLSRQNVDLAQAQALGKALYELCRSGRSHELLRPYGLPGSSCSRP